MTHYSEDELAAYSIEPDAVADRAALENHVERCEECHTRLAFVERIDDALAAPEPWIIAAEIRKQQVAAARPEPREYARQLDAELKEARRTLSPFITSPRRLRQIRERQDLHKEAVVRVLCECP